MQRLVDPRKRNWLKASLALSGYLMVPPGVMALTGCTGAAREAHMVSFDGSIMGTGYGVRVATPSVSVGSASRARLPELVHKTLMEVDALMSTWRPRSEISLFNARTDDHWQRMAPATFQVLTHALQTSEQSQGAFDPSVGPLVDLWGFGAAAGIDVITRSLEGEAGSHPADESISRTLAHVGYKHLELDSGRQAIRKHDPNIRLDLSGIAKGYAVDRVAMLLDEYGVSDYLVEIGGEIRTRGVKADGSDWQVAIEQPATGHDRNVFRVVPLRNRAVATSGDYRHFFMHGGKRYSHSIDPRSGRPVEHELASVSVIAQSTMLADALSTALMIMGPADAKAYAEKHAIAALLILKSGNTFQEMRSSEFDALLV